ncbi:MAG: hypothetical protein C5B55_04415 [Blastocatellia bacterium]|nr:MAG: hypothetical protein C5B55_04415 [Blastocatellia bacterium]
MYCFEDGTSLRTQYDPQATIRISEPLPTDRLNQYPTDLPQRSHRPTRRGTRWPIYVFMVLLLFILSGGVVVFLVLKYSYTTSAAADSSQRVTVANPGTPSSTLSPQPSPSPSPSSTPNAQSLVGIWRTNVLENGSNMEITVTFRANGTSRYLFKNQNGQAIDAGTWQYSDETLFEKFSNGASGKGAIRWLDPNTFEITIIDNGVPAYAGLKRRYRRVG